VADAPAGGGPRQYPVLASLLRHALAEPQGTPIVLLADARAEARSWLGDPA